MSDRRRPLRWAALLLALAVAVPAGLFGWRAWDRHRSLEAVEQVARSVAAGLHAGTLPAPVAVPDRGAAEKRLQVIYRGMGAVRPQVALGTVRLADNRRTGTAELVHTWAFREDLPPWTYSTQLRVRHTDAGWRADWSDAAIAPDVRPGEGLRAARLTAERGEVMGADDVALVKSRPVVRVGIDRIRVPDDARAADAARTLAGLVDVDPDAYAARVRDAGEEAFVEAIVYRERSPEALAIAQRAADVDGLRLVADDLPLAPSASFARPILGVAGQATAEVIEKSEGRVRVGDVVGLSGLQAAYDEQLFGTTGFTVEAVDQKSWQTRRLFEVKPLAGDPVRVTLSESIQTAAEEVLANVEPASGIVAIRPSDGHILAAASGPGGEGYSTATLGEYAPGSTFKVVTTLALLRAGLTPDSEVDCSPTIDVGGRVFKNYDDYPASALGRIPLRTAVAQSCNTALIGQQESLSDTALADAAAALGITAEPSLGVPAVLGSVPAPGPGVDRAAAMIGQGEILTSPLAMATAAASIARGAAVTPVLVPDRDAPAGTVAQPLTAQEADALRTMMRAVVTEGSGAVLGEVPGEPVLAKTGTAEYGSDDPPRTRAWVIAIQGDLAIAAFVADGDGGARTAGPLAQAFLERVGR